MTTPKRSRDPESVRAIVREGYTRVAGSADPARAQEHAARIGYGADELAAVPAAANLGVGCGNPGAIDALRPGETVLDLGSGAGFDALLAARQVGPEGRVIGVDMTEAMLEKARANARAAGLDNVEFRRGTIEQLPVEDASVDVVLSNCVINLSPEKQRVYREAYRVLRPGGRLQVSDIVLERALPESLAEAVDVYLGCVGGAALRSEYLEMISKAGFREVRVEREARFADALDPGDSRISEVRERLGLSLEEVLGYADAVTSLHVFARK